MPNPPAPEGLSEASCRLWPGLLADVRAATGGAQVDVLLLEHVLRAMDRLATVSGILEHEGLTVEGSKGQTRPHPMLSVESNLRREIAAGLERLGIGPSNGRENFLKVSAGRLRLKYPRA